MKTNTEMAKIVFRYAGTIAALFILTGKLDAQTRIEEKPVMQVVYVQDESNYLVFKVSVTNTSSKRAIFRVSDNNYEPLYSEAFTTDSYTKTVKVPKYDMDVIEFRLTSGKDIIKKVFEVKVHSKETVAVTESNL
ncbi:MAG TPA: hypothetical protein VIU35_13865 [Chitinophagaceae bacterium]